MTNSLARFTKTMEGQNHSWLKTRLSRAAINRRGIYINMYKMLCLDIDGTLLNSKHHITEQTKTAIRKVAKEQNISVILISARY